MKERTLRTRAILEYLIEAGNERCDWCETPYKCTEWSCKNYRVVHFLHMALAEEKRIT